MQQFGEGSKAVDLPASLLCDEDTFERLKKCNGCCVRQLCEGAKAGNGGLAGRHPPRQAGCLSRVAHRLRRHPQRLLPGAASCCRRRGAARQAACRFDVAPGRSQDAAS